jgi:hypothetical protein
MGRVVRLKHGRSHEDSVVESELRRWGFWVGIQYAAEGYSPMSTLSQILSGRSDRPGHRILCIDPPERVGFAALNNRVLMLRREFYEVLVARYALPCKADGQPYRSSEVAPMLGISGSLFADRLTRARTGYKRMIFPEILASAMRIA